MGSISPCKRHGRIRLFCLPFAGGGSAFYHPWKEHLPADIELAKIQLPGRETRLREKAFTRMEMLVATLTEKLTPWLDRPFAFFGHSMGALITFELVRMIRTYNHAQPQHIFVSGYQAPHLPRSEKISTARRAICSAVARIWRHPKTGSRKQRVNGDIFTDLQG